MMRRILVVDDEPEIVRALGINLKARGFEVVLADSGPAALRAASLRPPDAVVLDLGLPGIDGIEVIRGLRGWTNVPILVLSGRSALSDKIEALDAGADDFLTKPFNVEELLARLRALSRRAGPVETVSSLDLSGAHVDLSGRRVSDLSGNEVHLTETEWRLLEVMVRHPGKLLTRRFLLDEVWGPGVEEQTNYLRVYVQRLRRKLEADPARPRHIINVHGVGYRFEVD